MQQVTKIFGPPGTGKTTRLLSIVDEALQQGIRPERIAYMAFTKRAATEAINRARLRFNLDDDQLPWFRTIHSMAFKLVGANRSDIMQEKQYQDLGRELGFQFTTIDSDLMIPMGTAMGDRVARIEQMARISNISLEEQWHRSRYDNVPWLAVEFWDTELRKYKAKEGLLDYTDLLENFNETIDVDLFIVDEAQDLSPLQWRVVEKASATAKHVYLAGDDDQCIYGWAGADVSHFLGIRAHTEILPISYRLPRRVYQLADSITQRIGTRQNKQWESRAELGAVNRVMYETHLDMSKGSWMLLSRNHSFLKRFEAVLQRQGYPYLKEGRHSTNDSNTKAILLWEGWRKGKLINQRDLKLLRGLLPQIENWYPRDKEIAIAGSPLESWAQRNWMDALPIAPNRREYIRACLANRESLTDTPRITVSTIHRVKGGEADNVALITDITERPWKQLREDEEQRVLYVAVTRARHTLNIVAPQSIRHYSI